jgi:hypothetical protein
MALVRRLALPIALVSLAVNAVMLVASSVLWGLAIAFGWIDSVAFVAHVSMLALVFASVSGLAAATAGLLALVPTDDLMS